MVLQLKRFYKQICWIFFYSYTVHYRIRRNWPTNALSYMLLYLHDGCYMFQQCNAIIKERLGSWWWHYLAETCRNHRVNKEVYNSVHLLVRYVELWQFNTTILNLCNLILMHDKLYKYFQNCFSYFKVTYPSCVISFKNYLKN
jgi:hypothetical protein